MEGSIERWSLGPELELDSRTRTARRFRSRARTFCSPAVSASRCDDAF